MKNWLLIKSKITEISVRGPQFEQAEQVQAELVQLGFKKLFLIESRRLWGIYDHYDWEVYRKLTLIKKEAELPLLHEQ